MTLLLEELDQLVSKKQTQRLIELLMQQIILIA
jgi:hypothetical protein